MYASLDLHSANDVLIQNLSTICTVEDWAAKLDYLSAEVFAAEYKAFHGYSSEAALISMKVDIATEMLSYYADLTYAEIAEKIGQKSERALNSFIKKNTGRNIRYFRETYYQRKTA